MNKFRYAAIALSLALAASAFAVRPDGPAAREGSNKREAAPLLYLLPDLGTGENVAMEIRIVQGKRQLVREVVALPAGVPAGAAVDVLFTHPDELKRLRAIEAKTPGSLRFIALAGGRVVTDEPFANIEASGAKLSTEAAIGEIREIEARPAARKPLARALGKDPDCTYWCDVQQNSCLEWCDPRGDSCTQCYTWVQRLLEPVRRRLLGRLLQLHHLHADQHHRSRLALRGELLPRAVREAVGPGHRHLHRDQLPAHDALRRQLHRHADRLLQHHYDVLEENEHQLRTVRHAARHRYLSLRRDHAPTDYCLDLYCAPDGRRVRRRAEGAHPSR
jgi:hypothetical protein